MEEEFDLGWAAPVCMAPLPTFVTPYKTVSTIEMEEGVNGINSDLIPTKKKGGDQRKLNKRKTQRNRKFQNERRKQRLPRKL